MVFTGRDPIQISKTEYEQIKAEWFDETAITPSAATFYRYDARGRRLYIVEMQIEIEGRIEYEYITVVSVTSIIGACAPSEAGLKKWWQNNDRSYTDWIFKYSALYGSYLHIKYSELFLKKEIPFDKNSIRLDMFNFINRENEKEAKGYFDFYDLLRYIEVEKRNPQKDLYAIYKFIREKNVRPIAIEYPLFDANISAGGVADLICEMNFNKKRVIALIDYKTGKYSSEDHGIQLAAYSDMWNKYYPDLKIEYIFNIHPVDFKLSTETKKLKPYNLINRTSDIEKYKTNWYLYAQLYQNNNPELSELKRLSFNSELTEITIDTDIDIEEIDIIKNLRDMRNRVCDE